jgi:2',3'-cyclic-nucleotide 2'-phosphodiesterase (5'-nucleotidase family)
VSVVQATVDHIKATEKNVTRFIAMTHIGYDKDIELAQKTRGVHLIVGGHSHTLLGSMEGATGPYPTIEKNLDGEEVFIVTSYRWGEYLGYIDVAFDSAGRIVKYTGGPVHLTNQTEQEPKLQAQIKSWRGPFEKFAAEVVGSSDVVLGENAPCVDPSGVNITNSILQIRASANLVNAFSATSWPTLSWTTALVGLMEHLSMVAVSVPLSMLDRSLEDKLSLLSLSVTPSLTSSSLESSSGKYSKVS